MKFKFLFLFACLIEINNLHFGQINLEGKVMDAETQAPLAFANIGIRNKNTGTRSLDDGTFSIQIPGQNENDTLTFSMVGYTELKIPIKEIVENKQEIFKLRPKTFNPVVVTVSGLTETKFGIKGEGLVNIGDGSVNQDDIFEIAQVIRLDTTLSKITSVSLYIIESKRDSATFRINFYSFEGSEPGERLIEKNIVQTKAIREGWLTFDLSAYTIYLQGKVAVAIEFIPTDKQNIPIYYGIKLGGTSKSFVRSASLGTWNVPPHHYRMFITARVDSKKGKIKQDDTDERESIPQTVLYSEFVRDSFSIFVNVPENYEKKGEKIFPVIYLLDANVYFDVVAGLLQQNKVEAILVGVGYKDFLVMDSLRNRDYTFPEAPAIDSFPVSGGAMEYLAFLTHELQPYMHQTYRIDKANSILMGHSLGGYFTLFALYKSLLSNENYFQYFVAASPSLQYGNRYLTERYKEISAAVYSNPVKLFMTFGEREDSEDGEVTTQGFDTFHTLMTLLEQFENIHVENKIYEGSGHMQTAVPTFMDAVLKIK